MPKLILYRRLRVELSVVGVMYRQSLIRLSLRCRDIQQERKVIKADAKIETFRTKTLLEHVLDIFPPVGLGHDAPPDQAAGDNGPGQISMTLILTLV